MQLIPMMEQDNSTNIDFFNRVKNNVYAKEGGLNGTENLRRSGLSVDGDVSFNTGEGGRDSVGPGGTSIYTGLQGERGERPGDSEFYNVLVVPKPTRGGYHGYTNKSNDVQTGANSTVIENNGNTDLNFNWKENPGGFGGGSVLETDGISGGTPGGELPALIKCEEYFETGLLTFLVYYYSVCLQMCEKDCNRKKRKLIFTVFCKKLQKRL
ncbi:MAG: hypothetical protein J6033_02215 [Lachnospiraceae bacterium]|nr:hypothetical protein [Lachnospiraceae bacterium]